MSYPSADSVTSGSQTTAIGIALFATVLLVYALLIARDLLMGVTTISLILLTYIMYQRLRIERYRMRQLATSQRDTDE